MTTAAHKVKTLKLKFVFLVLVSFFWNVESKLPNPSPALKDIVDPFGGSSATGASDIRDVTCGTNQIDLQTTYRIATPLYNYGYGGYGSYPSGFECTWKFLGVACYPVITCGDNFLLPSSNNCTGTNLQITDDLLTSGSFCGSTGPQNVSTGSTLLNANFVNSFGIPTKGFQCIVKCVSSLDSGFHVLESNLQGPNTLNCNCGVPGNGASSTSGGVTSGGESTESNPGERIDASSHRVVGGRAAEPFFYKWQAAIMPKTRKNPFCGASLLNDRFILTAAHCVVTTGLITFPQAADVVLNAYHLKNYSSEPVIRRSVLSIHQHPFYDTVGQDYDFAVIEFYPPVDLVSTSVPSPGPICLPARHSYDSYVGVMGTVTGWGTTSEGGDPAPILQEASIPIISNEECAKFYSSNEKSRIQITERMLCAAYPQGGIDSCQGDSGGPFVVAENGRYHEVGVVSFGEGCARKDKPGVYSRVTIANDWIRQVAKLGSWCKE